MSAKLCANCGKKLYPSRLAAIRSALYGSGQSGIPLRVYHCPAGPGWHLTKQRKREAA
ncbi:MAG TPA: hypothetical protein VFY84_19785 [Jiangellales bacterium]|nr:hypothetical protein [Jiangellales bacterium]